MIGPHQCVELAARRQPQQRREVPSSGFQVDQRIASTPERHRSVFVSPWALPGEMDAHQDLLAGHPVYETVRWSALIANSCRSAQFIGVPAAELVPILLMDVFLIHMPLWPGGTPGHRRTGLRAASAGEVHGEERGHQVGLEENGKFIDAAASASAGATLPCLLAACDASCLLLRSCH